MREWLQVRASAASHHAAMLGKSNTRVPTLNKAEHQWLQEVLDQFIDDVLARGVIIVPTLRSLLP